MKRLLCVFAIISLVLVSCGKETVTYTCTFSIVCDELLDSSELDESKRELVPSDGYIFAPTEISFSKDESVFDVLKRVCLENKIHLEYSEMPLYGTAYIEGIANLYEFDAGALSGWVYTVNGESANYGASAYKLSDGDTVVWSYTVDGRD